MSSSQTYLLALYVTLEQESAIRFLFSSNGWVFKKKGDIPESEMVVDNSSITEHTDDAISEKKDKISMKSDVDDDSDHGNDEINNVDVSGSGNGIEAMDVCDKGNGLMMSIDEIKVEVSEMSDNDQTDNCCGDAEESHTEDENHKSQANRKSVTQRKSSKKLKKSDTIKRKSSAKKQLSDAELKTGVKNKTSTDRSLVQKELNIKRDDCTSTPEISFDPDNYEDAERTALEIELQETDDIDHYETVHKSLSPDEPFNPPTDVQENDGFSPSLGCYYCHECGYTFQLQRWYVLHKWNGKCVYKCQVCSEVFTFRNFSLYRDHIKTHKRISEGVDDSFNNGSLAEEESKSSYRCTLCSRTCKTLASLNKHKERHGTDNYACKKCHVSFPSREILDAHNTMKHENLCEICGEVFHSKVNVVEHRYKMHKEVDQKLKLYKCPFEGCDKEYLRKGRFNDHMSTHTGVKPYSCKVCGKAYGKKYSCLDHEAACSVAFNRKLVCPTCGLHFKHRSGLKYHTDLCHYMKIFKCKCGKQFKYKPNLRRHEKKCNDW